MANPVWPATVPFKAYLGRWSEAETTGYDEFQVEDGFPRRRMQFSKGVTNIQYRAPLTLTQRTDLMEFYRTTLKRGLLKFDATHPVEGVTREFQFVSPPTAAATTAGVYEVSMQLVHFLP